ncbi:MAG: flagellar biosynthetic protein FliR [Pirellulales bacterium]|nr:flagellar biosynthetic protein FliR [Pirellulales bacterium]
MNPSFLESLLLAQFATFVLVLARVGGLIATAPIFGTRAAPVQARALLAVAMSLLITPLHASQAPAGLENMLIFGKHVLSESLVGLLLGLGVMILLSGIQLTGQIISQLGGTAVAEGFDPLADENVPVYSQFFYFLTLAMFVLIDGHRLLVEALLDTYAWLPPGKAVLGRSFVDVFSALLGQSFLLGIRAAAPAMAALLLATLVLGLIGRTVPQINILVVGFSVNALLTVGAACVTIGTIAWAFPQQGVEAIDKLCEAVRAAAR